MSELGVATRRSGENPISRGELVPEADFIGTVHSVFATACNLALGDLLIVVHDAAKPHTPTSVRVAAPGGAPWSPATHQGDDVVQRHGVLTFGEHILDLRHLPVWAHTARARPTTPHLTPPDSCRHRSMVMTTIEAAGTSHAADVDPQLVEYVRGLRIRIATAIRAGAGQPGGGLANGEINEHVDEAARRLIGFGPGLTPAGDDVLVGLLAVLHRRQDAPGTPRVLTDLRAVIPQHLHRTTDVSAHYLRLALEGHFGESLENLLDAIDARAPAATLRTRTTEMLSLGSTSGSDTVRGLLVGLDLVFDHSHHPHLQEDVA